MQIIKGVLFEPVGCLAEFPPEPFHEIAVRLYGKKGKASRSASRSYWHLLNLGGDTIEALELQAVDSAAIYDDVIPALAELKSMGVKLLIASSLSSAAVARFLAKCTHEFDGVWNRNNSGGIKPTPLKRA